MSVETADLIERALRDADGTLSATETAAATGVSRVSARRYLEFFVDVGRAEVRLRYGAAGRPQRRYAWKPR
jgi:response regulator of citrate/malate metabolism